MEGAAKNQDNQVEVTSAENGVDTSIIFGNNRHFAFIYKKTEKLVTAVYLITDFIKDTEPLKWKMRQSSLGLMELILDWNSVSMSERRDLQKQYQTLALEIVSLSNVAHHSSLISEMNFRILSREFQSLISSLEKDENKKANEDTIMLDPGFFDVASPEPLTTETTPNISKGQSLRTPVISKTQPAEKDTKDNRQTTIINILSKANGLSVKDIAKSIKGVSEKTIQRELLSMVASGVLKKEGERRWSTYFLVSRS